MHGDKGLGPAPQAQRSPADWTWLTFGIRVEPFTRAIGPVDTRPAHSPRDRLACTIGDYQFDLLDPGRRKAD